jgi:hypothetical protein
VELPVEHDPFSGAVQSLRVRHTGRLPGQVVPVTHVVASGLELPLEPQQICPLAQSAGLPVQVIG